MEKQIGKFKIRVRPPYPTWCEIENQDDQIIKFIIDDVYDLQHAVNEIIRFSTP